MRGISVTDMTSMKFASSSIALHHKLTAADCETKLIQAFYHSLTKSIREKMPTLGLHTRVRSSVPTRFKRRICVKTQARLGQVYYRHRSVGGERA